jgi:hypothetical protein
MFVIDPDKNEISPLTSCSFSSLGFRERDHLQEWIAKLPECLGEELLIIQKEFSGFSDTMERLDLLALDKQGSLVIIENKLDDTGRDVTWQALKYASYCSRLSKDNLRKIYQEHLDKQGKGEKAEDKISDFLDGMDYEEIALNKGVSQRIILIAANFRKEVTSTVLWLMNYKLRIQCFKATPFQSNGKVFLNLEQIIPTPDAAEFMIGLAEKVQDEATEEYEEKNRHIVRRKFWTQLLSVMGERSQLFQSINPGTTHHISTTTGLARVRYAFVAVGTFCRVEVYISKDDKEANKLVFDALFREKEAVEHEFGNPLGWEALDERIACRIKFEKPANIYDEEQWPEMIEFLVSSMMKLEKVFAPRIARINL